MVGRDFEAEAVTDLLLPMDSVQVVDVVVPQSVPAIAVLRYPSRVLAPPYPSFSAVSWSASVATLHATRVVSMIYCVIFLVCRFLLSWRDFHRRLYDLISM